MGGVTTGWAAFRRASSTTSNESVPDWTATLGHDNRVALSIDFVEESETLGLQFGCGDHAILHVSIIPRDATGHLTS